MTHEDVVAATVEKVKALVASEAKASGQWGSIELLRKVASAIAFDEEAEAREYRNWYEANGPGR